MRQRRRFVSAALRTWLPTILALAAGSGCGGFVAANKTVAAKGPASADAMAELRFRVASNPGDNSAHIALARLELKTGQPGSALRRFLIVADRGKLVARDRLAVATLLATRARERVVLADGAAYEDIAAARRWGGSELIDIDLEYRAMSLALLAAARNRDARALADWSARIGALRPGAVGAGLGSPASLPVATLGHTAQWLWRGEARRFALGLFEMYWRRGGREPSVLSGFAKARYWWGGAVSLDLLERRALANAGVELCSIAGRPDELGCTQKLASLLMSRESGPAMLARAQKLWWRVDRGQVAAGFVVAGLRAWLAGDAESWMEVVTARVDVQALAVNPVAIPSFAAPTLLRAAGHVPEAHIALDAALAGLRAQAPNPDGGGTLRAIQGAVLLAEAAAQGRDTAVIDELLSAGAGLEGWVLALRDARARMVAGGAGSAGGVGAARLETLTASAPARARELDRLGRAPAATDPGGGRWRALARKLGFLPGSSPGAGEPGAAATGSDSLPLGYPSAASDALAKVALAYAKDPARADRVAHEFVDGAVAIGSRAPAVAALFQQLGDPVRALRWRERILAASPKNSQRQLAVAIAAARAGEPDRALVHAALAAASSGDAGATYLVIGDALVDSAHPTEALIAARSATQLVPWREQIAALALVSRANGLLGRGADVARARRSELARIDSQFRGAVTGRWRSARDEAVVSPTVAEMTWMPADPRIAVARARALQAAGRDDAAATVLRVASAWCPRSVVLLAARAKAAFGRTASGASRELGAIGRRLLAIALEPNARARNSEALEALASMLEASGLPEPAAAARRQALARY